MSVEARICGVDVWGRRTRIQSSENRFTVVTVHPMGTDGDGQFELGDFTDRRELNTRIVNYDISSYSDILHKSCLHSWCLSTFRHVSEDAYVLKMLTIIMTRSS